MAEEDTVKREKKSGLKPLLAGVGGTGVIGLLLTSFVSFQGEMADLKGKVQALERDEAKWGTLAEQQKQLLNLTIELEVLKRIYGGHERFMRGGAPPDLPEDLKQLLEERRNVQQAPSKDFRQMQQKKYEGKE